MSKMRLIVGLSALLAATAGWCGGVGELYKPGERAAWIFELGGKRIGVHVFEYVGTVEFEGAKAHRFKGRVEMDAVAGVPRQKYEGDLWLDDAGHPLRHLLQARLGESYSSVDLRVKDGKAYAEIKQGPSEQRMEVDLPQGAYLQANNFIGYFEIVFGLLSPGKEAAQTLQLLSSNTLRSLPYEFRWSREFTLDQEGATSTGEVFDDSLGEKLWIGSEGRLVRLEIPGADLVVRRSDENVDLPGLEPPAPAPAETSFDTEEVEIVHGEVTLAGTITRPRGAKGRLPAVFFVSGSGGQDRNGMSSGMDTGTHEILDRLTAEGFLVLRVDDRGVGSSRGPTEGIGFRDLVADARAAVGFLFEREDVDPERIAIIGHSEGGLTATILAAERPIAALVLMAAAGRSLIDVIVDQNVPALEAGGLKGEALETSLGAIRDHLLRIGGDDDLEAGDLPPEFRSLLANRRWFQDHARERPLERVKALRCPVLILQGDRDIQISPDKDARALERALAESDHADHTLHVIPGLDHLFKNTGGRESEIDQYYEKRPVDEGFLDLLSGWLAQRLLSPGDAGEGGEGGD